LRPATLSAWQEYLQAANDRTTARLAAGKPFLWIDEEPDRVRRVRQGEIIVAPLVGRGTKSVPSGLVHDWIGAVFIPNATVDSLLGVVHDYDGYKNIYKPAVMDSRSMASNVTGTQFSMTMQRHVLFVNAAMRALYRSHDFALGPRRGYTVVDTTSVQQIQDYGQPSQTVLPPDTGSGYLWRISSISRYEQRDEGVYLEIEALALSRDIPVSVRWMVSGVVNHLSVNSLNTTLDQTRQAVGTQLLGASLRNRTAGN
jgi:hypothetical protein